MDKITRKDIGLIKRSILVAFYLLMGAQCSCLARTEACDVIISAVFAVLMVLFDHIGASLDH